MKEKTGKSITKKQCVDTGLAMTIIAIIVGLYTKDHIYQVISLFLVVVSMSVPKAFYPLAIIWFGMSELLGSITSKILLGLVFFLIVTPVGLFRRIKGKDRLNLRGFKRGILSGFKERNHTYTSSDLINTF
jgi:ABC-type nitrate/sulfonate/bicarbonate transport system permease component